MIKKHDPKILDELLNEPEIKSKVAKMSDRELVFFKELLVLRGVYQKYALERQKKQTKEIVKPLKKTDTPKVKKAK